MLASSLDPRHQSFWFSMFFFTFATLNVFRSTTNTSNITFKTFYRCNFSTALSLCIHKYDKLVQRDIHTNYSIGI